MSPHESLPPSSSRTERREARREAILEAAMQVVLADGFDALTMPRLASEAGSAVGALYRYFQGKDEVIAGLQCRAIEHFDAFLVTRLAAARSAARGAGARAEALTPLFEVAQAWFAYAEVAPVRHQLMDAVLSARQALLPESAAREVELALAPVLERCRVLFEEAVAAKALEPGDAMVRTCLLWAGVHGLDHLRKRDRFQPEEHTAGRLLGPLVATLVRGWGASAESIAACTASRR